MTVTETKPVAERPDSGSERPDGELLALDLPLLSVHVHRPHWHGPPRQRELAGEAVERARAALPPAERIAYYGALGALAVFGVIEWPVAVAIGVGTVIARRAARRPPVETQKPPVEGSPAEAKGPAAGGRKKPAV